MPNDLIRYDLLVQEALCGVVSKVLADAARNGHLPGDHHFYITFRTHAPGVRLSSRMRDAYPDEMTIILQHQYEDLKVTEHAFEVGLSFKGIPEMLLVPFEAMTGFFDPSVQFSLKFEPLNEADDAGDGSAPVSSPLGAPVARGVSIIKPAAAPAPLALATVSRNDSASAPTPPPAPPAAETAEAPGEAAKVVSIDAFRKKP